MIAPDPLFYGLDTPKPHRIDWDGPNTFRGTVLHVEGRAIDAVEIAQDGKPLAAYPVDKPNPVIQSYLPHHPSARRCRFEFERPIDPRAEEWLFEIVYADGAREELFTYPLGEARRARERNAARCRGLEAIPMPDGRLVHLTQGHEDVEGYRDSILPCVDGVRSYLAHAGIGEPRSVLDFGCGTGRLLAGWAAACPEKRIHGCDVNPELAAFAARSLAGRADVRASTLLPPLPWADGVFDLVTALSVFTHLSRETQREWGREIARVLRPGGAFLVTVSGELYVHLAAGDRLEEFRRTGYLENVTESEGANAYAAFHTARAVEEILPGFRLAGHFPTGRIDGRRVPFQIGAAQDVCVLRKL